MHTHTDDTGPLIRLADVADLPWIPRRRRGRKLSFVTVWRWALRGRGGRRLRVVRVGGTLCTSEAWLREFFESLAANDPMPAPTIRTPARRQREVEAAEAELEEAGI
jgi:hypothetical protein